MVIRHCEERSDVAICGNVNEMEMYNDLFSEDVGSFFRSPVREIFKRVDLNAIYSFAGGYPSADTFPLEEIDRTMSEVITKYGSKAFQ